MKGLLLDQGLPRSTGAIHARAGWEVVHVSEIGMSKADDTAILERVRIERRASVTLDADFHALLATGGETTPSVVRIRKEGLDAAALATSLRSVWPDVESALVAGAMVTITARSVRIRRLPIGRRVRQTDSAALSRAGADHVILPRFDRPAQDIRMHRAAISGTGIFVPPHTISNEEFVASYNDCAMAWNRQHEARIAGGELAGLQLSSVEFIEKASGHPPALRDRQGRRARSDAHAPAVRGPARRGAVADGRDRGRRGARGAGAGRRTAERHRRGDLRRRQHAARLPGDGDRDPAGARHPRLRLRHERGLLVGHLRHRAGGQRGAHRHRAGGAGGQSRDHLGAPRLARPRLPLHLRRRLHGRRRRARRQRPPTAPGRCSARGSSRSSRTTSATTSGS